MSKNNQLNLQLVINQLLELDLKCDDVSVILKKALNIILKSPISDKFLKKGVVMLAEENGKKLKLVAKKNVSAEVIKTCNNVDFGDCICSTTALTKEVQFISYHKHGDSNDEHGHYSLPILYQNELLGVLTIYLLPHHKKDNDEITSLETITKTLALILYRKKDIKYLDFIKTKLDKSFGNEYFKVLAKFLTKELGMKYCLIGKYDTNSTLIKSLVFVDEQKVLKNIEFSILDTPCKNLLNQDSYFYPNNIQQLFPNNPILAELNAKSYYGLLIKSDKNYPIGVIVFVHNEPIENEVDKNHILKLILPRLTSECERENYEDKLIQNEKKYKDIFHKFQDIFIRATLLSNGETIISEVSPSITKFAGYKPSDLIGKSSSSFYYDISQREEMMKTLKQHKQIKDYPLTFLKKSGELVYALVTSQLIIENNKPTEIRVVARDVTDKRIDEIRKEISYLIAKKTQRRITNFNSLAEYIHKILGNAIDTSNFSICLLNLNNNTIDFPIFYDDKLKTKGTSFSRPIDNGLTEYIIKNKNFFIKNKNELDQLIIDNQITYSIPSPKIYISFPLKCEGNVVGALTVKSYKNENQFINADIELLDFIAVQLSNIIERDQWQTSLIEKEKYFRALVESSLEVTGIVGEDAKINYISESVETIMAYSAHNFIGKYFYDFIPAKYHYTAINQFERVIQGKSFKNPFLVKLITKENKVRIIEYTLNNQLKNKDIKGIIFNAHDITEEHYNQKKLKISQEALNLEQENYRTIFNNANDGIILIDKKLNIIETNNRMTKILGYSKNELLSKKIVDLTLKREVLMLKKQFSKLAKQEVSKLSLENLSIHKSGKQIICNVFIKTVLDSNKKIDYYIAFVTDVTKTVEAIKRATDLENALESSANILFIDKKGFILHASKKACLNTGYTQKELVGQSTKIFNSKYHPKEYFKNLWTTIQSGKVWNGEIKNKRKDKTDQWFYMTVIPIKDINNEIDYYINVRQDITKDKVIRVERIKEVIDAQEKEKETFAKELHDGLGQMLLASKMNLTAIKSDIITLDESTQNIYNNSLKLLTDAIHEARNVSHGLMSRALVQFGLSFAINDIISNLESTQTAIKFKYIQNINEQRFDEEIEKGLYRVLQELISNIIKHSEATTAEIKIIKKGKNIQITVKDNGVGILNNILDPNKSLGIGLKNIETRINYLSGSFIVNENNENGTEFNITVPTNTLVIA